MESNQQDSYPLCDDIFCHENDLLSPTFQSRRVVGCRTTDSKHKRVVSGVKKVSRRSCWKDLGAKVIVGGTDVATDGTLQRLSSYPLAKTSCASGSCSVTLTTGDLAAAAYEVGGHSPAAAAVDAIVGTYSISVGGSSQSGSSMSVRKQLCSASLGSYVRRRGINRSNTNRCNFQPAYEVTNDDCLSYIDIGDCTYQCFHWGGLFWYEERLKGNDHKGHVEYNGCCNGGKFYMNQSHSPPALMQNLLHDRQFMVNIRAYNQMFAMTSIGAKIDESVNVGRGPYVFKICGQIYHWIGSLCPEEGQRPRFLQLYIYDTENEVSNRMHPFGGSLEKCLDQFIVQDLVNMLDNHNGLVKLFRTARDRCNNSDVPDFKIRLFSMADVRRYELPTSDILGAIVFEDSPKTRTDFDVVIEAKGGHAQRVDKLHQSYMSLQYPLLFVFGEPGFFPQLRIRAKGVGGQGNKISMNAYYKYQLHGRFNDNGHIFKCGRLFQQYEVTVFCSIKQYRLDFVRNHQNDIRSENLSGLHDAVARGDRDGIEAGGKIMLPRSFTGGPRYMYNHYLDALAICRSLGNPQYFITFTCNANWPEVKRYMESYPLLTASDRPDIDFVGFFSKRLTFL